MTDLDTLLLEQLVYADSAYVADLVLNGRTQEADEFAQRPDVQTRIRRWKATQR